MTRYVIDEPAFRALVRGVVIPFGQHEIILAPTIGWLAQIQASIDAARSGLPRGTPSRPLRPNPPDPPEAREMLATYRPPRRPQQ